MRFDLSFILSDGRPRHLPSEIPADHLSPGMQRLTSIYIQLFDWSSAESDMSRRGAPAAPKAALLATTSRRPSRLNNPLDTDHNGFIVIHVQCNHL